MFSDELRFGLAVRSTYQQLDRYPTPDELGIRLLQDPSMAGGEAGDCTEQEESWAVGQEARDGRAAGRD